MLLNAFIDGYCQVVFSFSSCFGGMFLDSNEENKFYEDKEVIKLVSNFKGGVYVRKSKHDRVVIHVVEEYENKEGDKNFMHGTLGADGLLQKRELFQLNVVGGNQKIELIKVDKKRAVIL
jgi:hypothetical protein